MTRIIKINNKEHIIERSTIRIIGNKIFADGKVLAEGLSGDVLIKSDDKSFISILSDRLVVSFDSDLSLRKILDVNDLIIDPNDYVVKKGDLRIDFCKKEFEMLYLLASSPGRVYTRDQLLNNVWGRRTLTLDRTVDVHARRIRAKIGNEHITTVKGIGYKFT